MKKLFIVVIFCMLLASGCKAPETRLVVKNGSSQPVNHVYLDQTDLLSSGEVIANKDSMTFKCIPNIYDVTIRTVDFAVQFESVQIMRGSKVTLTVMDPIYGIPPSPEVQEQPAWYPPIPQISAVIHYIYLGLGDMVILLSPDPEPNPRNPVS